MGRARTDSYFDRVYEIVARIPRGKVVTYGQIAAYLGHPRAARTVGWAMHSAPRHLRLPCHRVVNAAGTVAPGEIFGGAAVQRRRLEVEGITFTRGGRINLAKHRWVIGAQG
jgi:methylated-DNA-protein-cysteine methyltransferase related protein